MSAGVTLDAGALIAIERNASRMLALLDRLRERPEPVVIPAGALAQVWRGGAGRQHTLARLLRDSHTEVVPLDELAARAVGLICAETGVKDVIDVSVVLCARERGHPVVTSDAEDLRAIDPSLPLFAPE